MDESSQLPLPMTAATQSHTSSEQNGQRGPRKGEANLQSHSLNYATPSNTAIRAPQTPQRPLNSPIYEVETRKASPSPILTNHLDEGPHGRFYDERQSSIPPKAAPLNGYRASPSRFDPSSPWPSSFETPKNDHGEESPSMLGSGGTAARTGRVIEFLGSELDKSKREISLLSAKLEEEQQRSESSRLTLESLKITASQYETMYDQAQRTIARKDRKLEDVRAELGSERERRTKAEREKDESAQLVTNTIYQSQRALAKEKELAVHASTQYEVLKSLVKNNERTLETEVVKMQGTLDWLRQRRQEDSENLKHLESISQEIQHKQALMDQTYRAMKDMYKLYKSERDESLQSILEKAQQNEDLGDSMTDEMKEVLGKLRYVFNLRDFGR